MSTIMSTNETEEWKSMSVLGFSNYSCSESGKVMNISTDNILKGSVRSTYILYTLINNESKRQTIRSDVFIAKLFMDHLKNEVGNPFGIINNIKEEADNKEIDHAKKNIIKNYLQNNIDTMNNFELSKNCYKIEDLIWLPLIGFSKYQITPKGIRNAITHKMLVPFLVKGYPKVGLYTNDGNNKKQSFIHKLIALQYIFNPNPEYLVKVNHKNGIKDDFRIENLEWVTQQQNVQHAVDTGLRSKAICNGRKIELLDEKHNVIVTFMTSGEAGNHVGCSDQQVRRYMIDEKLKNNVAIINGYILRYKTDPDFDGEIWRNLNTLYPNINNKYKVSNYGRIKNLKNRVLTATIRTDLYSQIGLSNYMKSENLDIVKNSNDKNFYVHVLVAYAFLEFQGNRQDYQVNHKDKNPSNNHLNNLEILTIREHNIIDHGKPVLCVTQNNEYYIFPSQGTAAYLPEMKVDSIHYSITNRTCYKNHYWYNYESREAQDIISKFQSEGISSSIISPKIEIISEIITEPKIEEPNQIQIEPKRKLKLIIVS